MIEDVAKKHEERLAIQSRNFESEINKLREVAKERNELFEKRVSEMKASFKLKINELQTLMLKEVKNIVDNYKFFDEKGYVVVGATIRLVELNKDYSKDLKVRLRKRTKCFQKNC
ncbi:unnamed protein product [Lactuca virosa]|uniref:Uncharacterized protein n=1 Tax=Lactuca virosa TaxID=75947 RepID=A0AAU9NWG9_9ASTR|nr:unnamed protein product [Lactuca virosa]